MRAMTQVYQLSTTMLGAGILALVMSIGAAQASVEISTAATKNISCANGVCSTTDKKAVLNVNDLTNMLAAGDVKITTGNGAVTITVQSPFTWTSTHRLTLDAQYNVSFRADVTVAGKGGVTIVTNDGGSGGDLLFLEGGKVDFWDTGSSLIVNGTSYTLEGNLEALGGDISNNASGAFALANDYDASADGKYIDSPVKTPFAGPFDGLGHVVQNLTISVGPYKTGNRGIGLFRELEQAGRISHLQLNAASVAGYGRNQDIGAVVGRNFGLVEEVASSGHMNGGKYTNAGGLVGRNETGGILALSTSSAGVRGGRLANVGGLAGVNDGAIRDGHASGHVTGNYLPTVGGLVGSNTGQILTSSSEINIDLQNTVACGGIAGSNSGDIEQAFWTGSLKCQGWIDSSPAGGLVGNQVGGTLANNYAVGSVTGVAQKDVAGGLLGAISASDVSASYAVGAVAAPMAAGGFAGAATNSTFARDYWDADKTGNLGACGEGTCAGVKGVTDAQLQSRLPRGFDAKIWGQNPKINNGYPYLLTNPPLQ
jgi:hypothetical protein